MLSRNVSGAAVLLAALLVVAGCAHSKEEISIAPLVPAAGRVDPGLGPGTRALSLGPGYKSSPNWSPGGDRIAFIVDGEVVDKPAHSGNARHWKMKNFFAEDTEWISKDTLTMLGSGPASSRSVYRASAGEDSLDRQQVATRTLAMSRGPRSSGSILALENGPHRSWLALTHGNGQVYRVFTSPIRGRVTGLSPSPDGSEVVLAVRPSGDRESSELRVFDLRQGRQREITRLEGDLGIFGAPQWTKQGLYFVAGERRLSDGDAPLYDLYHTPDAEGEAEAGAARPAPGVGEDFVAASISVSPDRERLAVIGRLNPKSPPNLYILDLVANEFRAVTTNEDMEIKTEPDDLAWAPDGKSVVIVARGTPSTEPEVRAAPAGSLLKDFYNLYEIPVEGSGETRR